LASFYEAFFFGTKIVYRMSCECFHSQTNIYQLKLKIKIMGNLLYLVAVVLVILWIIGFFFNGFGDVGGLIHILLVIAVIAIILKLINRAT
jgi:hypothetical protein